MQNQRVASSGMVECVPKFNRVKHDTEETDDILGRIEGRDIVAGGMIFTKASMPGNPSESNITTLNRNTIQGKTTEASTTHSNSKHKRPLSGVNRRNRMQN